MTQKEKDLLLKDLCGRLPYGVKFPITVKNPITSEPIETTGTISGISRYGIVSFVWNYEGQEILVKDSLHIKDIKPYLFPLSSMTEGQKQYLKNRFCYDWDGEPYDLWKCQIEIGDADELIDWFHKNHFDYRNLIEKGLAIDATNVDVY